MKINYFCKLVTFFFLLLKIKTEEEDHLEQEKKYIDLTFSNTGRKSQTINLNDLNFDSIVQNGKYNRWLIIFYSENIDYCKKVKSIIDKIIEEKKYKSINNIKFGSVDIDHNLRLVTRFNISGIPVVILVENNKMLQISNFPLEDNFIRSIEIENIATNEYVINLPGQLTFYKFIKNLFIISLNQVKNMANRYLEKRNIKFQFTALSLFLCLIFFCVLITILLFYFILKCFCKDIFIIKEDKEDKRNEIKNIVNKDNKEENKNNNDDNEETKKKIEEKKENEMKEKLKKK